jgi:hypothetical protein
MYKYNTLYKYNYINITGMKGQQKTKSWKTTLTKTKTIPSLRRKMRRKRKRRRKRRKKKPALRLPFLAVLLPGFFHCLGIAIKNEEKNIYCTVFSRTVTFLCFK